MSYHNTLPSLIHATRLAVERGDMYVGMEEDFPGARDWARMMEIPVGVFGGRVLLKLRTPRRAINDEGDPVAIVSHYAGVYYDLQGRRYTINQLAWVEEKTLPED